MFCVKKTVEYFLDIINDNDDNETEKLVKKTLIVHYLCKEIYIDNNDLYNISNIDKPKPDAVLSNLNMIEYYDNYKYDFLLSFLSQ